MIFFAWKAEFNHYKNTISFLPWEADFVYLWVLKHRVKQQILKVSMISSWYLYTLVHFPLSVGGTCGCFLTWENLAKATGCTWLSYKAHLSLCWLWGSNQVMLGRSTQRETKDRLQFTAARIDAFSLTTHKELDTANNHVSLEAVLKWYSSLSTWHTDCSLAQQRTS